MSQAYISVRFSTPQQEKGDSKDRQLRDCRAFCERNGWEVEEVIEDLGRSAWTGANLSVGNLGKFAERVRAGEVPPGSILVVEKLDRLSRQAPRITQRWMEDLCALGLRIATVAGSRVYDDASLRANPMESFEILFGAHLAWQESEQKSERVLARIGTNMALAKTTGRVLTAKAPGWLLARADRSGFDLIAERVAILIRIYEMAAEGKGARWIAKTLNEEGVPAWGKWRKPNSSPTWETTYVALLLRHPSVEGDYVPGFSNAKASRTKFNEPIIGYYPRVVPADLVARARAVVDSRKIVRDANGERIGGGGGGRHTRNVANLFAGFVFCGECGNKMHLRNNGDKNPQRFLQCVHATRSRGCGRKETFRYPPFEAAALDTILHLALDNRFFSSPDRTGELSGQLAEITKALADRAEQSSRLVKALARTDDAPEIEAELASLRQQTRELEAGREKTSQALEAARGAVTPGEHIQRVRDVREAMDDADSETRRTARLRVQSALRELGCRVTCEVEEDGERIIGLVLRGGMLASIFDNAGKLLVRFNLMDLAEGDLETPEGLQSFASRFSEVMPEAPGRLDPAWLATFVRRYKAGQIAVEAV